MKPFSAFLVIIKTNFGKIIGLFVDSKFESTRDMNYEINGFKYSGKQINNVIIYYFLDIQLVKCPWKHSQKACKDSDNKYFLATWGINIKNDRSK
jgi:hypothetical protein